MERLPAVLSILSPLFGILGIADGARVIAANGAGRPILCVFGAIASSICCLVYVRLRGELPEEEEETGESPKA